MLKVKNTKQSVYALRKSQQDVHHKYSDDGKCKDVGPTMIILKDDDDDKMDSSFPTAFSPTENKKSYSFDIDLDLDVPENEPKETKSGMADLYAQVVPKAQRDKDKKDVKRSKDNPASNGDVKITVDPYSQYAQVTPKSQRNNPSIVPNGKPASNEGSDEEKQKIDARSKVLSAIGNEPRVIHNGDSQTAYHQNRTTAQRTDSVIGGKVTYNESAEL